MLRFAHPFGAAYRLAVSASPRLVALRLRPLAAGARASQAAFYGPKIEEAEANRVTVRHRAKGDLGVLSVVEAFLEAVTAEVAGRAL